MSTGLEINRGDLVVNNGDVTAGGISLTSTAEALRALETNSLLINQLIEQLNANGVGTLTVAQANTLSQLEEVFNYLLANGTIPADLLPIAGILSQHIAGNQVTADHIVNQAVQFGKLGTGAANNVSQATNTSTLTINSSTYPTSGYNSWVPMVSVPTMVNSSVNVVDIGIVSQQNITGFLSGNETSILVTTDCISLLYSGFSTLVISYNPSSMTGLVSAEAQITSTAFISTITGGLGDSINITLAGKTIAQLCTAIEAASASYTATFIGSGTVAASTLKSTLGFTPILGPGNAYFYDVTGFVNVNNNFLTTTVTGGPGVNLNIDLINTTPQLTDLVTYLNTQTGYTAVAYCQDDILSTSLDMPVTQFITYPPTLLLTAEGMIDTAASGITQANLDSAGQAKGPVFTWKNPGLSDIITFTTFVQVSNLTQGVPPIANGQLNVSYTNIAMTVTELMG